MKCAYQVYNKIRDAFIQKHPEAAALSYNIYGRFATGYAYDFIEAMSRLEFYWNWYKENKIEGLKPSDFPVIDKQQPFLNLGRTRNGYLLVMLRLRKLFFKLSSPEDIARYIAAFVNAAMLSTADQTVDRYILIVDLKSYTNDNFDKAGLQKLTPVFSNCFPDVLFRMYIVNAGFIAASLYSVISIWLHEVTRKKIQVIKEDNAKIQAAMSEEIELAQIPKEFGGGLDTPL